jgi:hypothetical protein
LPGDNAMELQAFSMRWGVTRRSSTGARRSCASYDTDCDRLLPLRCAHRFSRHARSNASRKQTARLVHLAGRRAGPGRCGSGRDRASSTAGLGLETAGITLGAHGEIPVDVTGGPLARPSCRGDVTDRVQLTPSPFGKARLCRCPFRRQGHFGFL